MSRTALILETNPVITERYLDYTNESDWRIMLKDTLNAFLEKLQQEKFDLVVAEESLLPQPIIHMLRSTGTHFLLSTNKKDPEIPTIPRDFNRTELLAVFDRMVPYVPEESEKEDLSAKDTTVTDILSDLEDEEETFELTSDAVITEAEKPDATSWTEDVTDTETDLFGGDESLFGDKIEGSEKPEETADLFEEQSEEAEKPETAEDLFEEKSESPEPEEDSVISEPETPEKAAESVETAGLPDDAVKAAVTEWLDKNARSIIKEIILEQLTSFSGKNNG